jgi:WD40 repeat protein
VRLWDTWHRQPIGPVLRQDAIAMALAFSPDGRTLAVAEATSAIRLLTMPRLNGGPPLASPGWVRGLGFDQAGRRLLVADRHHWAIHDATREDMPVLIAPIPTDGAKRREIETAALSPDGRTVVTGMIDGVAMLWDVATRKPRARTGTHLSQVSEVAFRGDGAVLLTYSNRSSSPVTFWKHRAGLWDVQTGRLVRSLPDRPATEVYRAAWAADGRLLLGCGDRTARLVDVRTNKPVGQPLRHASSVTAVAFSPDGRRCLTGCRDGTLRLWDTATRRPLAEPMRHSREVTACAFSPDGGLILAADLEGGGAVLGPGVGSAAGRAAPPRRRRHLPGLSPGRPARCDRGPG